MDIWIQGIVVLFKLLCISSAIVWTLKRYFGFGADAAQDVVEEELPKREVEYVQRMRYWRRRVREFNSGNHQVTSIQPPRLDVQQAALSPPGKNVIKYGPADNPAVFKALFSLGSSNRPSSTSGYTSNVQKCGTESHMVSA